MSLIGKLKKIAFDNIEGMSEEEARNYLMNEAHPASGSVGGLIYYNETEPIACEHHDEIIEMMQDVYGNYIPSDRLSLNDLAWFAWEILILGNEDIIDEIIEEAVEKEIVKE